MESYDTLLKDFKQLANKEKAKLLQGFFKTSKGEYGEGDIFLGIMVPQQRILAKRYYNLSLNDLQKLLNSKIHEHRLTALFILIAQYKTSASFAKNSKLSQDVKSSLQNKAILTQEKIYKFYLKNTKNINNWDLVDLSAPNIVGDYLLNHKSEQKILFEFAKSKSLWERRIAVLATFTFIKEKQFDHTLKIAEMLLKDKHDLMHKAVGWMLRELGKRNESLLCNFLDKHKNEMPRTMLRYAIEKFDEKKRKFYMLK